MAQANLDMRERVRAYCRRALVGADPLDLYPATAGPEADLGSFLVDCWRELLDCVEHTPKQFTTGAAPWEWTRGDEYLAVYLNYVLLSLDEPDAILERSKKAILRKGVYSQEEILDAVASSFHLNVSDLRRDADVAAL